MTELQPSPLNVRTSVDVQSSMCLLLDNAHNSSSLPSSSSSSSGGGGVSPDSMYSTGSLSGGGTDSPLDEDMPEGLMGRQMASREGDSGIQSPDCRPDDNGNSNDNDNSVSIYLDAYGDSWRDDLDDHDVTLALTQRQECDGYRDDDHVGGGRSSEASSVTEPPTGSSDEEDDNDEEDSFLSLSSVDVVMRGQGESDMGQVLSLARRLDAGPLKELHQEELLGSSEVPTKELILNSARRSSEGPVTELHEQAVKDVVESRDKRTGSDPRGAVVLRHSRIRPRTCRKGLRQPVRQDRPETLPQTPAEERQSQGGLQGRLRPQTGQSRGGLGHSLANRPETARKRLRPPGGRAANRREEGGHGAKKSRSSSNRTREAVPTSEWGGDPKPKTAHAQADNKRNPSGSTGHLGPGVAADGDQEPMEGVGVERGRGEEEVTWQEQCSDGSHDNQGQTLTSKLSDAPHPAPGPPGARHGPPSPEPRAASSACVSTVVRTAPSAGVPKMKVLDSSAGGCGPASSWKTPQNPAPSRLPVKGASLSTSISSSSLGSTASENNSAAAANKGVGVVLRGEERCVWTPSTQNRLRPRRPADAPRPRANTTPAQPAGTGQKACQTGTKTTQNALQRSGAAKVNRASSAAVEKRGVRPAGGRPAARVQPGPAAGAGPGIRTEGDEERDLRRQVERKDQRINQLGELVAHGNRNLEALALVIQHIVTERDEAMRQRKELSLQLKNLQEELRNSASCCERLQVEKEQARVEMEVVVQDLQEQRRVELAQLEAALRRFYAAEWDKAHQTYQEEMDRCQALMIQQVEEVRSKQEALRKEQQVEHTRQMETLKQEHELSLAELKKSHEQDLHKLDHMLKLETSLKEKIESLHSENTALNARLSEEEDRRKALADKSQKDSRVVYLEQELESLKVVLEIKTNQLHQQDKKLMQMDRLMESNVKLEECVTKLQQENEDYKARMDKHAALSKQLSSEQAMLQQTLQKESKVNKRLSMENEELLWKLHNGDLSSPRRLSPTSPFQSPRNSASFPSTPLSPR
ncbi:uncharacterized protein mtus1b [Brachyhypopomus gauderio]|uniref:uncharacterized protein mtus1b n=1 Tax=Brachyhypopomus gauderio TaxID=698409 RepID=UPI004042BC0C